MKDKLRELAEMVREAYRAGFIAACKWPAPVSQDVDSSAYNKEFNAWSFSVREKHAAILDAEGDGGAVAEVVRNESGQVYLKWAAKKSIANFIGTKLYTHPARSGVVSDEDVNYFLDKYEGKRAHPRSYAHIENARSCLEHFAKGERHER